MLTVIKRGKNLVRRIVNVTVLKLQITQHVKDVMHIVQLLFIIKIYKEYKLLNEGSSKFLYFIYIYIYQ